MREKLLQVCKEYDHLNELMATNEIASNPDLYRKHAKSQKDISALVHRFNAFLKDAMKPTRTYVKWPRKSEKRSPSRSMNTSRN